MKYKGKKQVIETNNSKAGHNSQSLKNIKSEEYRQ